MSDTENQEKTDQPDHEVNPADNPGPRGNDDVDQDRLDRDREDLERAGAN